MASSTMGPPSPSSPDATTTPCASVTPPKSESSRLCPTKPEKLPSIIPRIFPTARYVPLLRPSKTASIAAQFRWPGNDLPERGHDAGGVEPRQDGIDGRAGAVAGDDDWDLLRRQTPLGGLAAPLARCSRQIAAFALEGFEDEGLVRLDDPGQAPRLVEIERGQEPMSPPERGGVGHLAAFRGLRHRLAGDQRLRLVRPAILVMQAGQRRPGQRVECLPATRAAVPRLAASLAPGTNVIPTAVRTAKARNPTPPDLRQQVFLRRGILRLRDRERRRNSSLIRQHRSIDRVSRSGRSDRPFGSPCRCCGAAL